MNESCSKSPQKKSAWNWKLNLRKKKTPKEGTKKERKKRAVFRHLRLIPGNGINVFSKVHVVYLRLMGVKYRDISAQCK